MRAFDGAVAQPGERRVRNAKVRGSIPLGSTNHPEESRTHGRFPGLPNVFPLITKTVAIPAAPLPTRSSVIAEQG